MEKITENTIVFFWNDVIKPEFPRIGYYKYYDKYEKRHICAPEIPGMWKAFEYVEILTK